jgi:hypothetical protein
MKKIAHLQKLDIPPEVVDSRLREMSELWKLGMSMKGAKWVGKVSDRVKAGDKDGTSSQSSKNHSDT